jgi:hypothetical protein
VPLTDVYQVDGDGRVTAEALQLAGMTLPSGEVNDVPIPSSNWRYFAVDGNGDRRSVASYWDGDAAGRTVPH